MDLPPPPVAVQEGLPELPEIEAPPAPLEPLAQFQEQESPLVAESPLPTREEPEEVHIELPEGEEQSEEAEVLQRREPVAPLFVSTDDYQAILGGINDVRRTLGDSENVLARLAEIKNAEERIASEWKSAVEDIERKLNYVDQVIAKSQQALG